MSTDANEIPILKRLTALEPEMELPAPTEPVERHTATGVESPTLEVSESEADSGVEGDIDSESDSGSESNMEIEAENTEEVIPADILHKPVGVEMPVWIWMASLIVVLAYLWGIAYALSPVRDISERRA